jgi:hypothetical protein
MLIMASGPWSDDEIHATIDVYFQMLTLELAGEGYRKTEFRREVERDVARSPAAIEYKFNNVSAVLDEMGAVWIPGYKPLRNVQDRLRTLVQARFEADSELRSFMLKAVADVHVDPSTLGVEVDPPAVDWPQRSATRSGLVDIDFAAIESSNRALGRAGEITVVDSERLRLSQNGREDLAAEVRHVSVTEGDGLGYDIQSFQGLTEEPMYIEVKTTRYGKEVPFYISQNEVEASSDLGPAYRLLRLYKYGKPDRGYYTLSGPLERNAQLKPDTYRGLPAIESAR